MVEFVNSDGEEESTSEYMLVKVPDFPNSSRIKIAPEDRAEFWSFVRDIFKMKCKEVTLEEGCIPDYLSLAIIAGMEFHSACPEAFHKPQREEKPHRQIRDSYSDDAEEYDDDDGDTLIGGSNSSPGNISV